MKQIDAEKQLRRTTKEFRRLRRKIEDKVGRNSKKMRNIVKRWKKQNKTLQLKTRKKNSKKIEHMMKRTIEEHDAEMMKRRLEDDEIRDYLELSIFRHRQEMDESPINSIAPVISKKDDEISKDQESVTTNDDEVGLLSVGLTVSTSIPYHHASKPPTSTTTVRDDEIDDMKVGPLSVGETVSTTIPEHTPPTSPPIKKDDDDNDV